MNYARRGINTHLCVYERTCVSKHCIKHCINVCVLHIINVPYYIFNKFNVYQFINFPQNKKIK